MFDSKHKYSEFQTIFLDINVRCHLRRSKDDEIIKLCVKVYDNKYWSEMEVLDNCILFRFLEYWNNVINVCNFIVLLSLLRIIFSAVSIIFQFVYQNKKVLWSSVAARHKSSI